MRRKKHTMREVVKKWCEANRKTKEFLKNATDEDFKRMFENVPKINLDIFKQ